MLVFDQLLAVLDNGKLEDLCCKIVRLDVLLEEAVGFEEAVVLGVVLLVGIKLDGDRFWFMFPVVVEDTGVEEEDEDVDDGIPGLTELEVWLTPREL